MWKKRLSPDSTKLLSEISSIFSAIIVSEFILPEWLTNKIYNKYRAVVKQNFRISKSPNIDRRLSDILGENVFATPDIKTEIRKMSRIKYKVGPIILVGVPKTDILHNKIYEYAVCRCLVMIESGPIDKDPVPVLIPTNIKKTFPKKGAPLGPAMMNSGLTYTDSGELYVIRKEEMNKVLVHELIHSLDFDIPHTNLLHNKLSRQECEVFAIDCGKRRYLAETYTETMACVLNSIMCACEVKLIHKDNIDVTDVASDMLLTEIYFGIYQTGHILTHFGFNNMEEFIKSSHYSDHKMSQTSDALSYYILKAGLIYSIKEFLDFIKRNNIYYLKFNPTDKIIFEFHDLAISCCKKPEFVEKVNKVMQLKIKNDTGRMTLIELI